MTMAAEPLVIYSHKVDPAGVLNVLRGLAPGLQVVGPPENWSQITIAQKRFLKKGSTIKPIARAPQEDVQRVTSSAMERHLAINWLNGDAEIYSQTQVST
jgi:hypothetical protein